MFKKLFVLVILASLVACQSVNTTGGGAVGVERKQRMFRGLSSEQVNQSAVAAYKEELSKAQQKNALNTNQAQLARLRTVASRLTPHTGVFRQDAPGWPWEVNLQTSEELNAYCMPGGKIMFYSGIIDKLKLTDAEIAAIMGHEIAHALREHGRERMSQQLGQQAAVGVGAAVLGVGEVGANLIGMVANVTFGLPHSRTHETEADVMGLELMARAGYDPNAAVNVWKKMAEAAKGGPPQFLSTHPSHDTRIKDLEKNTPKVMPLYQAAPKA